MLALPASGSIAASGRPSPPTLSANITVSAVLDGNQTGFGTSQIRLPPYPQTDAKALALNRPTASNGPEPNLARELTEASGLGKASLARIVGVSRTRFTEWCKGGGIGPDKIPHVMSLIEMFRDLRPILGQDMRGFVRSQSPAGVIEQLLNKGETKAVMGLALHGSVKRLAGLQGAARAHELSELPGWLQPARRLAWEPAPVNDNFRQQVMDEFRVSAAAVDFYVPDAEIDGDDSAAAVHVVYGS